MFNNFHKDRKRIMAEGETFFECSEALMCTLVDLFMKSTLKETRPSYLDFDVHYNEEIMMKNLSETCKADAKKIIEKTIALHIDKDKNKWYKK